MKGTFTKFAAALAVAAAGAASLSAQGKNGTDVRPFYVIAHNPNTTADAASALFAGANALEPDIMVLPDGDYDLLFNPDPPGLVVYHDYITPTSRVPQTLEDYLDGVHVLAKQFPQLAMILLDIKHQAATCENGLTIRELVKTHLNIDGVHLNVIYNVGDVKDVVAFSDPTHNCTGIIGELDEREGVMVDDEPLADDIVNLLHDAAGGNIAYGDGTLLLGTDLPRAMDRGSFLKASWGFPRFVYVYTIDLESTMNFFIDAGVDGIIADFPDLLHPEYDLNLTPPHIETLKSLVGPPVHPEIRMATPDDNLYKPELQAYGLQVRTMNTQYGGTNANLTFTLNGCRGSSSVTVNTGLVHTFYDSGRMEADQTDFVTVPSLNLGKLLSLQISNDGSGLYPEWDLADVAVSSARWLGTDIFHTTEYKAVYNATVGVGAPPTTLDLTPYFTEPQPTIACPAPMTVDNAPGKCNAVVTFAPTVDGMCPDVTAVSTPPSGSAFDVGTTTVSSHTVSPSFPNSPAMCSFTVTVKDVEAPSVACPGPITAAATGPSGAVVAFTPTAGDNCSATLTSAPSSGSVFAIGTTTVTSTAQDPSGNQSSCSFTVHVKGAAEQTSDLITQVTNLSIKSSTKNALLVKLNSALTKLQSGSNIAGVCGALADFISLVSAQSGKDIPAPTADALIAAATQIRSVVGCQG